MVLKTINSRYALDSVKTPGLVHVNNLTKESADAASRVLTLNTASNHIYTSEERKMGAHLHNHIAHHTLALYSMGATPDQIIEHMKHNQTYQLLPPKLPDASVVKEMSTIEGFNRYLGNEDYFLDYTEFFENEIRAIGYEEVLQKYLCGGDERADDILGRMYHGYVHSLMYVGMGLEFKQLPLVAEGLAQAAVHADMYYNEFFVVAERLAHEARETALPLSECLYHCHDYSSILTCSGPEYHHQMQPNGMWFVTKEMVRDGVCAKAFDDMARVCARYRVDPDDLERATAELINATVFLSAGAQHPPHECRYDFFLIHCTNAAIWHSCFLAEASLTNQQKARLLEYTGRLTLMMYAAMGCPHLNMNWVLSHSSHGVKMDWSQVFQRACAHKDDGHMAKLIRAIKHAEEVSNSFDHLPEFQVKQHMFLPAAIAAVDSFSDVPMIGIAHFDLVRGAGYAQQWEKVPIRACNGNDASVGSLKIQLI